MFTLYALTWILSSAPNMAPRVPAGVIPEHRQECHLPPKSRGNGRRIDHIGFHAKFSPVHILGRKYRHQQQSKLCRGPKSPPETAITARPHCGSPDSGGKGLTQQQLDQTGALVPDTRPLLSPKFLLKHVHSGDLHGSSQ